MKELLSHFAKMQKCESWREFCPNDTPAWLWLVSAIVVSLHYSNVWLLTKSVFFCMVLNGFGMP